MTSIQTSQLLGGRSQKDYIFFKVVVIKMFLELERSYENKS